MNLNRVLDDAARTEFAPVIEEMSALAPEMIARKIPRANVQQAFVFDTVQRLASSDQRILAVGAHEDTAWAALVRKGWNIEAVDAAWGKPLELLFKELDGKPTYDLIFSTSVIEHVQDDETFAAQIAALVRPGGYAVLTMDFQPTWQPGQPKPGECCRLYSVEGMQCILRAMRDCVLTDEHTWTVGAIDFQYGGCTYAFSTLVVRKQ